MNPTEDQLLEEIRAAFARNTGPDDAMTTNQIAQMLGVCQETARQGVRKMVKDGKAEVVRVMRPRWDGILTTVSAIRMV